MTIDTPTLLRRLHSRYRLTRLRAARTLARRRWYASAGTQEFAWTLLATRKGERA